MIQEQSMMVFGIDEGLPAALRLVRKAIAQQGLRIAVELDISARIRQELGAGVAPCVVLYVDDPLVLLEAVVFNRGAALLIPQPVVVTGDNRHADVLMRATRSVAKEAPGSVRDPLMDFQARLVRALNGVAERREAPALTT